MRILLALMLTACSCWGQAFTLRDQAFVGQQYISTAATPAMNPTNIVGVSPSAWWVSDDFTTGGGICTLPDRYVNQYNLTNNGNTANWPTPIASDLNGHQSLSFNASRLVNMTFTNPQPEEVWFVMSYTNTGTISELWQSTPTANYRCYFDPNTMDINAGSAITFAPLIPTNQWIILTLAISGTKSFVLTNNVALTAGQNVGANARTNLSIGTFVSSYGFPLKGKILEIAAYNATNTTLIRSNIYYYFTNRYGVMP